MQASTHKIAQMPIWEKEEIHTNELELHHFKRQMRLPSLIQ